MEIINEIGKQSPIIAIGIGIVWWLLSDRKDIKKETKELRDENIRLVKSKEEREREISEERREDIEATVKGVNSLNESVKHHTDAVKELSSEIRRKKG